MVLEVRKSNIKCWHLVRALLLCHNMAEGTTWWEVKERERERGSGGWEEREREREEEGEDCLL